MRWALIKWLLCDGPGQGAQEEPAGAEGEGDEAAAPGGYAAGSLVAGHIFTLEDLA